MNWFSFARRIWWVVALFAFGTLLISIPGYLSGFVFDSSRAVDASPQVVALARALSAILSFICATISFSLAVILYVRKSKEQFALFISFYLLIYAVVLGGPLEAIQQMWALGTNLSIIAQTVLVTLPTVALFCVFPNGRFEPRWTRWLVILSLPLNAVMLTFDPEEIYRFNTPAIQLLGVGFSVIMFAALSAQVYRYRRISTRLEQQQTKWVVAGFIFWIVYLGISSLPWAYTTNLSVDQALPWWSPFAGLSWWLSLNILPVTLTIAVLRFRLFDIDLLIRRTLVYGALTTLLAIIYYGFIYLTSALRNIVFQSVIGQPLPEVGIVISTLVGAALFNPLRGRVQNAIDRAFYRRKYNAARVLANFAETARDEVELDVLSTRLVQVVEETMQPTSVSVWMRKNEVQRQV
ncbi:MAG: hypothetical protein HY070_09645 [Chloroflexi bacterium]|nr:hypothetical protein [Chloroflexota bacterium]